MKPATTNNAINIKNKRASFDYEFIDTYTAGIVLTGTEIKSIRQGKASLASPSVREKPVWWIRIVSSRVASCG